MMLLSLDVQVVEDAAGAAKGTHDIRGECLKLLCRTPGILAMLFAAFYGLLVVDIRKYLKCRRASLGALHDSVALTRSRCWCVTRIGRLARSR
jgi:hypothetical protein